MKNLGLSNYASLVSMKLNNEMVIHVNPVEETSNVHYVLPLYQSRYKSPLGLQLIYNHQNLSTDLGLGKGIRTNYHMSLDYNDEEAYLTLSNGLTLTYQLNYVGNSGKTRVYKNNETNTTISVAYGTYDPQFFLYYKDGTVIDFTPAGNKLMVKLIRKKNGERYSFVYDTTGRMIEVQNNAIKVEKLTFNYTTNDYVLIQAWKTNKTGTFTEIKTVKVYKHTAANFLNFLWEVQVLDNSSSTTLLKDYYFGYSLPSYCLNILISEQLSNLSCIIKFDESVKVKSIIDELGRTITFTKINKYCSMLTDYRNKVTELMVDNEGRLICAKDNFRNRVMSTMFDDNNKTIAASKVIHFNPNLNGRVQTPNNNVPNDLMSATLTEMPSYLSNYYQANKCYKVSTTSDSGAKYVQIYNIEGNKFDVFSLGVWAKVNSFSSTESYATIKIFFTNSIGSYTNGKQFSKEIKIKAKDVETQQFEFYMTSAYAKQSYKFVIVELCYHKSLMSMDVIFDLYKMGLTSLYEYDENGNQITCLDGRHISELVFNGDNTLALNEFSNYEYDEKGNVIKIVDSFGRTEEMTYDGSNNLLTHSAFTETLELFNKNEYIDEEVTSLFEDNNKVESETDYTNVYIIDKEKQKYNEINKLYKNFEYSDINKEQVVKKVYKDNDVEELSNINYTYLTNGKISTINSNDSNSSISFLYDIYGRNYGYKVNNNMFTYNTYSLINGVPELISSSGLGMKDAYNYEYDEFDRLIKIMYSLDSSVLFEYVYDERDNVVQIVDYKTNIVYYFEYNDDNKLISYSYDDCVISNIIDENKDICIKKEKIDDINTIFSTHSVYKSLNHDFDTYKLSIRNSTEIMLCMFDEYSYIYKENENSEELIKYTQKIKLSNDKKGCVIDSGSLSNEAHCGKDGFLTLYNLNSSNSFTFNVNGKVNTNNSVAFSFKPTSSGTLLSMSDGSPVLLKVGLNAFNKIEVVDNNTTIFTSQNSYALNTWHFICITYDLSSNSLIIKIDDEELSTAFNNAHYSLYIFMFGSSLTGQITNIMIPQNGVISDDDYDSFYKSFKYLLALNESRKNTEGNIVKKSSKEFVRNLAYNFVPLNNGTAGFKDDTTILPTKDTILELPCLSSKNSEFIYNDSIEKSAYFAMGQQLVYSFGQSSYGSLSIHANRLFKDEENVLFDLVDANSNHITLSILNNRFKLLFGDTFANSDESTLLTKTNVWNVITLTWGKNAISGYDVVIWLNNTKVINTTLYPTQLFTTFDVHVGRNCDTYEKYGKCFNGLLEMLVFSSTFVSRSVAEIVSSINKQNRITHEYDSLNLLKKAKILDQDSVILTNEYEYKPLSVSSKTERTRISTLLQKEIINDDIYEYEYDTRGNVKTIKRNGFVLHEYTFDKLGRLLTADSEKYCYDNNGNITKITTLDDNTTLHIYEYDSNYSDLLISFNGETILYDSGNTYNPVSIGQYKTLTYQCNKLATYRDTNKGFCNHYFYDDLGKRVKKVKYNNNDTLLDTIKFYYDENGKLIHQKSNESSLSFLYDELNQLYGFIYNGNRYYYIKDSLSTILGIIDTSRNNIVQYNYDAWGNVLSVNDTSGLGLGTINPFRYKGYYYDEDTLMYYCKARYYIPLWRRWLTPDNPKFLDFDDTCKVNLFVYCANNPIMYVDPNGNVSIGKVFALTTLACAILFAAIVTVCTYGAGSAAGVMIISTAITLTANAVEVGILQAKKSDMDADTHEEKKLDIVDAIFYNTFDFIFNLPKSKGFTQSLGVTSFSIYHAWGATPVEVAKYTGINIQERFTNFGEYLKSTSSKLGTALAYGYSAVNVACVVISYYMPDEKVDDWASFRGYKLY